MMRIVDHDPYGNPLPSLERDSVMASEEPASYGTNVKDFGVVSDEPVTLERQQLRIEALRAAAQVVAPQPQGISAGEPAYPKATLDVADMFAQWLETGKR